MKKANIQNLIQILITQGKGKREGILRNIRINQRTVKFIKKE